jgi:hypothetical protein
MSSPVQASAAPTNPFHIARAYQTAVPGGVRTALTTPAEQLNSGSQPGAVNPLTNTAARRILAGIVPGKIDFSGATPTPTGPSIPLYHHPADKNAAATAVDAGRMIDVEG